VSDPRDDAPVPPLPDPPPDPDEEEWGWPAAEEPEFRPSGRFRMPAPREWLGIAAVVIVVLIVVRAAFWLIGEFLP
jgi:hypothetical protein